MGCMQAEGVRCNCFLIVNIHAELSCKVSIVALLVTMAAVHMFTCITSQVIEPVLAIAAALSVQSPFSRVPLGQGDISVRLYAVTECA